MERRQFTLDEANALVPWLEETFQRLANMRREQTDAQSRLDELLEHRGSNGSSSSNETMQQAQGNVDRLARLMEEGFQDILAEGIIVRDVATGLVDFPSQRAGRFSYAGSEARNQSTSGTRPTGGSRTGSRCRARRGAWRGQSKPFMVSFRRLLQKQLCVEPHDTGPI